MLFQSEPDEEKERDGKSDEACHLCRFEKTENKFIVIASQVFEEETRCRVEHDVERERLSFRMIRGAKDEEKSEDEDVELAFPNFRRPKRLIAVGVERERRFRIEDAEGRACRRTESVAVQEIGCAAERLP